MVVMVVMQMYLIFSSISNIPQNNKKQYIYLVHVFKF